MAGIADLKARRRAQRSGRMRGIRINIPAEALVECGHPVTDELPWYTITPGRSEKRGRLIVTLYDRERPEARR